MIRPLRSHRRLRDFSLYNQVARWFPMEGNRPASARACYMPSVGMAYALGWYRQDGDDTLIFTNESTAATRILTPTGPGRMSRCPVPPDRMLFIRGFGGSVSSPPNPVLDFLPLYDGLKEKGVTIVIEPTSFGSTRPHSDIVPVESFTTIERTQHFFGGGTGPVFRNNVVAEAANYPGGDLMVVEMDWQVNFGFSYVRRIDDDDTIDSFTTIATGPQTILVGCAADVAYDEDLCKIELAKYRSFKQLYLYPAGDMTNASTPADIISNGWQLGFDFIKGTTFSGAALPYGDQGTNWPGAAQQIVDAAMAFFS